MTQALLKKVQDMTTQIEAQKAALVETLKPEFKSLFTPFFEKWPQVKKFAFTQYTPYFNDGEECVFGVRDLATCIEGIHDPEESLYEWQDGSLNDRYVTPDPTWQHSVDYNGKLVGVFGDKLVDFAKDLKEICAAQQALPEDAMKELFGDHVIVTITREGVDVEEYDHE